jgi:protease-4
VQSALPAGAMAGVAKDLGWLAGVADGRKPFTAVTHCMCSVP